MIDGRLVKAIGAHRRAVRHVANVPLANVRRAITGGFEIACSGGCLAIQPVGHLRTGAAAEDIVNSESRRIAPRHRRHAARRAHGIEHIELLEVRALAGQAVEIRRLQPSAAVA